MKLSNRKKLLEDADYELSRIHRQLFNEETNTDLQDKIDNISSNLISKNDEKYRNELYAYLEKLKKISESMQEDYAAHKQKGISIEEWFEKQSSWKKAIYQTELIFNKSYKNRNLWSNLNISLTWLLRSLPWVDAVEDDGKLYDKNTGKLLNKPEPEAGLDPLAKSTIGAVVRAFTLQRYTMRKNTKKKIYEEKLDYKYQKANLEFKKMTETPPDFTKMEPVEVYNWIKKLVELTNI